VSQHIKRKLDITLKKHSVACLCF